MRSIGSSSHNSLRASSAPGDVRASDRHTRLGANVKSMAWSVSHAAEHAGTGGTVPALAAVLLEQLDHAVRLGHRLGRIDLQRQLGVGVVAVEHAGVAERAARQLDQPRDQPGAPGLVGIEPGLLVGAGRRRLAPAAADRPPGAWRTSSTAKRAPARHRTASLPRPRARRPSAFTRWRGHGPPSTRNPPSLALVRRALRPLRRCRVARPRECSPVARCRKRSSA